MGESVKASSLSLGQYIRDPRNRSRILIVEETGTQVFARGLTKDTSKFHVFLSNDSFVERVTNPTGEDRA